VIVDGWTGRLGPVGWGGPQRVTSIGAPGIVADWIIASIGRPNVRIDFPVGQPGVAIPGTGIGVPPMVTTTRTGTTNDIPPAIDRRDIPPEPPVIPTTGTPTVRTARDWFEYYELRDQGIAVNPPTRTSRTAGVAPASLQTTPGGPEMDLGTLATDLLRQAGTAYIQREFGPTMGPPVGMQPAFLDSVIPDIDLGVPGPGVFTPSAPAAACGGASPVYKKVCGEYKWVQPKRRRRKRLATQGDLKDLAALKGILGNGKAFEVWIATHS